jgi:ComF family protein
MCQRSTNRVLCQDCERRLRECQFPNFNEFWHQPLPVLAWGRYGGTLKRSIAALKYENQPQLADWLGDQLARAWLSTAPAIAPSLAQSLTVVPIPLHASKQQQRGYNQADLIARAFCQRTRLPLKSHGLQRIRATEAQFGLDSATRQQNLANAFQLGKDLLGKDLLGKNDHRRSPQAVLLLDDIYTTGATVQSATHLLRRHQISVIGIVAVAKA